jgi:hypothetical protein
MRAIDTADELRSRLTARGVAVTREGSLEAGANTRGAWEAFKELAIVAATDPHVDRWGERWIPGDHADDDLLLFEVTAGRHVLDFRRQFAFQDEQGEYLGMKGLFLSLDFHPSGHDAGLFEGTQLWGPAGLGHGEAEDASTPWAPTAADWIDGVEASDAFEHAFGAMTAVGFRFYFGDY